MSVLSKNEDYIFTSESVSEGHPDKICDQISDAILDEYLKHDPYSRVAVETLATTNRVVVAGEVRGPSEITKDLIEHVTRQTIKEIGYEQKGFHWQFLDFECLIHGQSNDIAMGVDGDINKEEGAGDQGIMFGYATDETEDFMPAPIFYAHKILKNISQARRDGKINILGPDAKSQISVKYEKGRPVSTSAVLVSSQHLESASQEEVRETIRPFVENTLPENWMCEENNFLTNPTGKFVIGGPDSDCGLTGRKIIVDTYGGASAHGGGAFSGKDPTKVDRSAAYIARYLAKNVVAAQLASRCTIQLAYAIGVSRPVAFYINNHGSSKVCENKIAKRLNELVDLSPRGIREHLKLNKPIYKKSASYGHFGRKPDDEGHFSWEKTDLIDSLKDLL